MYPPRRHCRGRVTFWRCAAAAAHQFSIFILLLTGTFTDVATSIIKLSPPRAVRRGHLSRYCRWRLTWHHEYLPCPARAGP